MRVFAPRREEIKGMWGKLHREDLLISILELMLLWWWNKQNVFAWDMKNAYIILFSENLKERQQSGKRKNKLEKGNTIESQSTGYSDVEWINPLSPELNPICYLLALLGAHHFLHVSRIRVRLLTFRLLMSYIYGAPILDVSRSHTTTQHSR